MRVLGIDYGKSKIGLAMGETDARLATPYGILENTNHTFEDFEDLVVNEGIKKVVVGVPLSQDQGLTIQAEEVILFVSELKKRLDIPVETIDERFSTAEAKRLMLDDDIKGNDDAIAAMTILQAYLDQQ